MRKGGCAETGANELATPAGFEPATYCLEGSCSIRLSYGAGIAGAGGQWVQGAARLLRKLSE